MTNDKRAERVQLNMTVTVEFKTKLARYCAEHELKMSHVVMDAVNKLIDEHEGRR